MVRSYGPRALLLEFGSLDDVMHADAALAASELVRSGRVVDLVPAARTLLVAHDGSVMPEDVTAAVDSARSSGVERPVGPLVEIGVHYDGDDLAEIAGVTGLSVEEVVARHSAPEYTCAFCGFVPGFSYLQGLDTALWVPRRPTPRTRVPAGSVAIAAGFSAVYPSDSPGGWHLLGRTTARLWDPEAVVPALVPPGTRVRFVPR